MRDVVLDIKQACSTGIKDLFGLELPLEEILITPTKKEHKGEYTLVTFSLAKALKIVPPQISSMLGLHLPIQISRSTLGISVISC